MNNSDFLSNYYHLLLWLLAPCFLILWLSSKIYRELPLPPGPRGNFFTGVSSKTLNVEPWRVYRNWAHAFDSPIISFRVFNKRIAVLNDQKVIQELLNKRASVYSDRPKAWMYHELCGRGNSVFNISSLSSRHKQYRKLLQGGLGARAVTQYTSLLEDEAATLLQGIAHSPENYEAHIRRNAAAVIMKLAYGYTISETDDFFIGAAEESSKISGWAMAPGRWLVDFFPILRFIPSWFPGAEFKRQAESWRRRLDALSGVPQEWTKKEMASGSYHESFSSQLLRPGGPGTPFVNAEQEDIVKWCAGGLYAGAADTTVSAILSFVLLMSINPHIQRVAQKEIDDAVGSEQVPSVSDLGKLPFLQAVLKEVLRCAPVAPLCLPHKLVEDDVYAGYRLPKDTTIIANVWAIMNDPSLYPSPSEFNPYRFTGSTTQPDPKTWSYGFGRRTCPGAQFSEPVMLITMSNILARFDIVCPTYGEKSGNPKLEFTTGITRQVYLIASQWLSHQDPHTTSIE